MHLLQDWTSQYPEAQVAAVVQPNFSNIHWHWTPNPYLASCIGVFFGLGSDTSDCWYVSVCDRWQVCPNTF